MTLADKLEAHFRANPEMWLDGLELAQVAGVYAWRSRCSDLRKRGMRIDNKQIKLASGRVASLYRYVGPSPAQAGA